MQSLLDFSANKSCPELSPDCSLLSDLLSENELSCSLQRSLSYPVLSEWEFESSSYDLNEITMTTVQDDAIEILSYHVEPASEHIPKRAELTPVKLTNGQTLSDDAATRHRKRVVRAVGVVTFLLVLFSIILIGISLNMSKEIDEMVKTHHGLGHYVELKAAPPTTTPHNPKSSDVNTTASSVNTLNETSAADILDPEGEPHSP